MNNVFLYAYSSGVFMKAFFLFGVNALCFCGWVNVAFGCDCVVNGGWETMRNVATTEGKNF